MNPQEGILKLLPRYGVRLVLIVAMLLCTALWIVNGTSAFAQDTYDYTVLDGDNWDTVAARTGVSVADLQAANPEAAERETGWLMVGETLAIPSPVIATSAPARTHRVQAGESWNSIAAQYNTSASLLRAANPQSIRAGNILYRGEELVIPPANVAAAPTATAEATSSAATTATTTVEATMVATPTATVAATATAEATVENTPEVVATEPPTATVEAEEVITATATVTDGVTITVDVPVEATSEVTATEALTETVVPTATTAITGGSELTATESITDGVASSLAFDLPACPERFADYSQTMTEFINSVEENNLEAVVAFLDACDALVDDGVEIADLNGDGVDDLVVVFENPNAELVFVEGDLVIFNSTEAGYVLGYRARAAGEVRLLDVGDLNLDELPDVAWVDTTCGASTCFDTVNVRSWDGTTWADWTDGTITMAYAEIDIADVSEDGTGDEITLDGGIYGSVGAGPQRSRTEIWASIDGAPYALLEKTYSQTDCLYHIVLDANRAFLDAPVNGFDAAVALYTQAVEDEALVECWVRNDELVELRSFSLFRLAVIAGYREDSVSAEASIAELTTQFPGSTYDNVGQVWLETFSATGDAAIACEDVTLFAEQNSITWEILADYGYTNPSFEAIDVCPILNIEEADAEE